MLVTFLTEIDHVDEPFRAVAARHATIEREFGQRVDSRTDIIGVTDSDGRRVILKHASDPEAISWLESASRFGAAVQHPAIAAILHRFRTTDGLVLVEEWAPGEILVDGYDPAVPDRNDPASAYQRLRSSPVELVTAIVDQLIDAHVAVAAAGFVAVDLYDGCVLVDFATGRLSLIDLDHYRPGPYVLDVDRQLGSASYMAPEEFCRGATIDERTTVFTLGRMGLVYLGCERTGPARRADFRGTDRQFAVLTRACRPEPGERFPSVSALAADWA